MSKVWKKEEVEKVDDEGGLNEAVETVVRSGRRREANTKSGRARGTVQLNRRN